MHAVAALMRLPVLPRSAVAGAVSAGVLGGVAGLVLGLLVHPPTAWFAVFELGIPAAIGGGILGLIGGSVVLAVRRLGQGTRGDALGTGVRRGPGPGA